MIVQRLVFRPIQESACVQSVRRNEVAPVVAAVRKIESTVGTSKGAVRGRNASVWLGYTEARPRCCHNHKTGFAAIFGGRRTLNHLQRLYCIDRKLIGENLALLVGNRLA